MIKLKLYAKNNVFIKEITLESSYIPRIGEIINLNDNPNFSDDDKEPLNFFVCDVFYTTENNVLTPELHCIQWFGENDKDGGKDRRLSFLKEFGWL